MANWQGVEGKESKDGYWGEEAKPRVLALDVVGDLSTAW